MLAILSDIHANLAALEAVVADAREKGCNRFISLGDVVGYGPNPAECIELLCSIDAVNILGNHDSYIALDESCPRSRIVSKIIDYQRTLLLPEHINWLKKSIPLLREKSFLFLHGGPDDPKDQYIYSISQNMIPEGVDWLFSGHTHVQSIVDFNGRGYCNPGSVGQPRDGDYRAAYATFDGHEIKLHRVDYNISQTVFAMKEAGFDAFCYENLYHGTQIGGRIDRIRVIR